MSITRKLKNPNWTREEIILALDLYFRLRPGEMDKQNSKVIELSAILNRLPIHDKSQITASFRNANGVAMKLNNFKPFDPSYSKQGMRGGSNFDEAIFNEFVNDKSQLAKIANTLRTLVKKEGVLPNLYPTVDDEEDENFEVKEGKVIYRLHRHRERDSKITKKKKDQELEHNGTLQCEVCSFDFYKVYGEIGKGFIECHHKIPLADLDVERQTRLEDLALVCANCHRMLHQGKVKLSVAGLKKRIEENRGCLLVDFRVV